MPLLHLYSDRAHSMVIQDITGYISDNTRFEIEVKNHFFHDRKADTTVARKLAALLVRDFSVEGALNNPPSKEDVAMEEEYLRDGVPMPFNVRHVYEGFGLSEIFSSLIEHKKEEYHVILTSRMFATWERNKYHGRVIICSFPVSLISTTGMVEAPARPKEYYAKLLARQKTQDLGLAVPEEESLVAEMKREFANRMLDYDTRLTQAAKGYALQAAAYFLTGDAFCGDVGCRLYNAHTQEELIHAQLESGKICANHMMMFQGR